MRKIEHIFVHCTASKQSWGVKELWAEFRHKGWKQPGYHYVITADGAIHQMLAVEEISNGVKGYNATAINVAYVAVMQITESRWAWFAAELTGMALVYAILFTRLI